MAEQPYFSVPLEESNGKYNCRAGVLDIKGAWNHTHPYPIHSEWNATEINERASIIASPLTPYSNGAAPGTPSSHSTPRTG